MAKVMTDDSNYTAIADAIRAKKGVETTYRPGDMAGAINSIVSANLDTLSVNANGTYTPTSPKNGFSEVTVAVPNSYGAGDEGKVVSNGALVAQESQTITENGTYDTTLKNEVVVNVSGGGAVVEPLSVTQNGTYTPPSGVDGYAPVTVNVSGGGGDVEPTLPSEYQEVEYIDFDGNSYVTIDSQYVQNGDVYETFAAYIDGNTSEQAAVGVDNPGSSSRFELYFQSGQAKLFWSACSARGAITALSVPSTSSNATASNVSVGDKRYFMIELYDYRSQRNHLRIGAYGTDTSTKFRSRLFKIKHRRQIDAIGDASTGSFGEFKYETFSWYKPCYRKSDNVAGWYDTHNDVFHTNEGSGTFVVGPDVN